LFLKKETDRMSDTESDSSEDLDLELTAEELEEAQQRLLQKEPKKSSGDIVIELDNKPKSKKYLPPEEFGIDLIDNPIGNFFLKLRCRKGSLTLAGKVYN
jgi:hypothetical protein